MDKTRLAEKRYREKLKKEKKIELVSRKHKKQKKENRKINKNSIIYNHIIYKN